MVLVETGPGRDGPVGADADPQIRFDRRLGLRMEYHDVNSVNCLGFVSGAGPHADQIHVNGTPIFTNESGAKKSASEGGRFNPWKAAESCSLDGNTHLVSLTIR